MESKIVKYNLKYIEPQSTMFQMLNENGEIVHVNDKWLEETGYEREEVIGKFFGDFLLKEDLETVKEKFPYLKDYGFVRNVPFKIVRKDGVVIEVVLNGISVYDEDGKFVNTRCELKNLNYFIKTNKYIQNLFEEEKFLKEAVHNKSKMNNALIYSTDLKEFLNRILSVLSESDKILNANILTVDMNDKMSIMSSSDSRDVLGTKVKELVIKKEFVENISKDNLIVEKNKTNLGFENIQELLEEGEIFVILPLIPENKIKIKKAITTIHIKIEKPEIFRDKWNVVIEDVASILSLGINTFEMYEKTQMMIETISKDSPKMDLNNYENIRFEDVLSREIERYRRYSTPFSIVVFNVNNFKKIDGVIGKFFLEQILEKLPRLVNKKLRGLDQAFRIDRDKFIILLPETNKNQAFKLSKRIDDVVSGMEIKSERLVCSFDVMECNNEDIADNIHDRIDQLFHEAKMAKEEHGLPC